MPTDRGIIMTGTSIAAILSGAKSMTRRVMRPQPTADLSWVTDWGWTFFTPDKHISGRIRNPTIEPREIFLPCPYTLGMKLYVKEAWAYVDGEVWYAADGIDLPRNDGVEMRSPLFMPRWAARIWLQITSVKVERLQNINEWDVLEEGINAPADGKHSNRRQFAEHWDAINGKRPGCAWADSPWVWVLAFRRVTP